MVRIIKGSRRIRFEVLREIMGGETEKLKRGWREL